MILWLSLLYETIKTKKRINQKPKQEFKINNRTRGCYYQASVGPPFFCMWLKQEKKLIDFENILYLCSPNKSIMITRPVVLHNKQA